jgi:adenine deaminase
LEWAKWGMPDKGKPIQEAAGRHLQTVLLAGSSLLLGSVAAQEAADTIYRGGPILTINDAQPTAEAVAVLDGRILAVGSNDDVSSYEGPETQTFDVAGRSLLPGFVDSLGHIMASYTHYPQEEPSHA